MNPNIVFQGFTGSGKTYLPCALGREACKPDICTRYIRFPDLLLAHEEAEHTKSGKSKLVKKYSSYKLLIIDEWLTQISTEHELNFLFEVIERRFDSGAIILCTQFKEEDWHVRLGSGIHADSIMDRISHNIIRFYVGDINMRALLAKRQK